MAESHPLLRQAMAIIEAIPEKSFALDEWSNHGMNGVPSCGTIACAGGWLAVKEFAGLRFSDFGVPTNADDDGPYQSISSALEISFGAAESLFGYRVDDDGESVSREYDPNTGGGISDKDLFLARCRNFLARA